MQRPTLYLFVGYPGAGKTTVAKIIEEQTGAVHLWADNVRQQMFAKPTHTRDESKLLYEKLDADTDRLLGEGKSVIFDTNFNFRSDRQILRGIAVKHQAQTVLVWITTARDLAKQRAVHSDEKRNGYDKAMPEKDFERMANNLQPPTADEQARQINGVDVTPEKVAALIA